jgi:hypothetical protein
VEDHCESLQRKNGIWGSSVLGSLLKCIQSFCPERGKHGDRSPCVEIPLNVLCRCSSSVFISVSVQETEGFPPPPHIYVLGIRNNFLLLQSDWPNESECKTDSVYPRRRSYRYHSLYICLLAESASLLCISQVWDMTLPLGTSCAAFVLR